MTFGSFLLGLFLMGIGFLAVRKTDVFIQWFGDISEAFGSFNMPWLSWKVFGTILILVGFMVAFGLLQLFIGATIGRLFLVGGV